LKGIRAEYPEYAAIHSPVLHDVLARLDKPSQAFFRRIERGEKAGFPRFKGRYGNRYRSFTYQEYGKGTGLDEGALVLSKIGRLGVPWSPPIKGTPKTVTVSQEADGWYVAISCAEVPTQPLEPTDQETGMDLGLESFATLAEGTMLHTPRCYRKAERYLAKCQRRVSKRKKGRARRRKAVCWLAKAHQTVRRQPQDVHHKTALALVRAYDAIDHEDVRVASMVRNHQLATSLADAGWNAFLAILSFKAANAGRSVVAVDPAFTSQSGSGCGKIVQKGLSVRGHACPDCGTSLHRDHNAAKNNAAKNIEWRPAAPSGTRGAPCGSEPRTRGAAGPCGVSV